MCIYVLFTDYVRHLVGVPGNNKLVITLMPVNMCKLLHGHFQQYNNDKEGLNKPQISIFSPFKYCVAVLCSCSNVY